MFHTRTHVRPSIFDRVSLLFALCILVLYFVDFCFWQLELYPIYVPVYTTYVADRSGKKNG